MIAKCGFDLAPELIELSALLSAFFVIVVIVVFVFRS
jgi:hypothetical protein